MPEAFKNILIIKPSSLGDIVHALPALSALRRGFPDAIISWLVRPEFEPILKNHPHLNETIIFDRNCLAKAWYNPCSFVSLITLVQQLRKRKFDAVIDLQGLFRTGVLAKLSGCTKRFGRKDAREFAGLFYTKKVTPNSGSRHIVDYYMKVVEAAGGRNDGVQFILPVDAAAVDAVRRLLTENNINPGYYAVFIPSSARPNKCWPVEKFAALADKISPLFHIPVIAVGTKSEKPVTEKLKALANVPIADLAGQTTLNELIALLKHARLVISNDTGTGHIAAALNRPLVMIFGPTNPAMLYPYARKNCVVAVEPDGRGRRVLSADPKHNINCITFEDVFAKVCEQLEQPYIS